MFIKITLGFQSVNGYLFIILAGNLATDQTRISDPLRIVSATVWLFPYGNSKQLYHSELRKSACLITTAVHCEIIHFKLVALIATVARCCPPHCIKWIRLTHWGRDKMAAIYQISLKLVPKDPINNILVLVRIMVWCWPDDKPLSEPMMVCFTDAHMRHSASMSFKDLVPGLHWSRSVFGKYRINKHARVWN